MKQRLSIVAIAAISIFTSCKKSTIPAPTPIPPVVIVPAPTTTSISANAGAKGTSVTITGTEFSSNNSQMKVLVNGVNAVIISPPSLVPTL